MQMDREPYDATLGGESIVDERKRKTRWDIVTDAAPGWRKEWHSAQGAGRR